MRSSSSFRKLFVALVLAAVATSTARAEPYMPSEADLDALVETDFSGGASTTTLNGINTSGNGIELDITWDDAGEGFTRVVLQRESFNTDLSAFSGLDFIFETNDSGVGVKSFVQTGDGFSFFESDFINITPGSPQTVALDFVAKMVTDTDNVRQFGFQMFGPASGQGTVDVLSSVVPEPSSIALLAAGCASLLGYRRRQD